MYEVQVYIFLLCFCPVLTRTAAATDGGNGDVCFEEVGGCNCERQKESVGFIPLPSKSIIPI